MNEADRETASRHRTIWEEFSRRPEVAAWMGRLPLPAEVTATVGFVIPVDDGAVCRRLQPVVERLEATGCVTPFPPDYWHITVVPPALLTGGAPSPPRLLPESFVDEALAKARGALRGLRPFEISVCGLNALRDVVVAIPYDGGRGMELSEITRSAVPEMPDRYLDGHEPLPHISLTQYSREDRLEEAIRLIREQRQADFGRFLARRLEMFVLSWHDGVPGPIQKHEIPLGGDA